MTGGGFKKESPDLRLRDASGAALDLGAVLKRTPKGATLRKLVIPETGRYFLDVVAATGFVGKVKFTVTIVPPAKFTATLPVDSAAGPVEVPFSAPPGAKLTIAAKPAKKSAGRPSIVAITGPGDADVLATGAVKTKRTTTTFTSATPLAGGDYVLTLGAQEGTAGPLTYTVTLKLPKTYDFDMAGVPAGDAE